MSNSLINNLHLITKIVFDTEFFYPERFVKVKTGDYITNALIVDVDETELSIVNITPVLEGDDYKNKPQVSTIHSEQVANGEIELIFPGDNSAILDKIYVAFRETSNLLSEQEHFIAEKSKIKDQSSIDERHDKRMKSFQDLINEARSKDA